MVGTVADIRKVRLNVGVVVPAAVDYRHESHAVFDEPASHQTASAEVRSLRIIHAVQLPGGAGLFGKIRDLCSSELHPRGELVIGDTGFEIQVPWILLSFLNTI